MRTLDSDYLVVGAGAMGMAFTDALVDHSDVHVTLVDRRDAPGGHWRDAYPFVQLHQASVFYGVASTMLGDGTLQTGGPEAGLHERAPRDEVLTYYDAVLERLVASGKVTYLAGSEHRDDGSGGHLAVELASGETTSVRVRRRLVDAAYLEPTIPATMPPPFTVDDDAWVVPVNELPAVAGMAGEVVVVGSGKTATDAVVWLQQHDVDPDRIVWVRPRDPWMLNRAVVQPDPVVATTLAADTWAAAADATCLEDMFLRLEAAGVMLRIDPGTTPTMARTPTLATWELDLLRDIERVVRLGHVRHAGRGELVLDDGVVPLARDGVVVHCAASGLGAAPMVPDLGTRRHPCPDQSHRLPVFLRGPGRVRRGDPRRRPRAQPAVPTQHLQQWPGIVGGHAGAGRSSERDLRGRARHRRLGEHLHAQPVAGRPRTP